MALVLVDIILCIVFLKIVHMNDKGRYKKVKMFVVEEDE